MTSKEQKKAAITKQPENVTGVSGSSQKLTVSASGEGLTYQWYYLNGEKTWAKTGCTGNKTNTITFVLDQYTDGRTWKCTVTDKYGNTVDTNNAISSLK